MSLAKGHQVLKNRLLVYDLDAGLICTGVNSIPVSISHTTMENPNLLS